METSREDAGWISDLVGALCDPIIIHQCAWATRDMVPDWLAKQITMELLLPFTAIYR